MNNWKLEIGNWKLPASAKKLVVHPLFSGSAVMIVGSNVANFLAYIYHLIFGRVFGPSEYSQLAAVLSVIGLIGASFSFLGLTIVKFVSAVPEKERQGLFYWFMRKSLILGSAIFVLLLILTPSLSKFLHIKSSIIVLLAPIFLFYFISFIINSFLQALKRFKEMVIASNIVTLTRLVAGLMLVVLGLAVFGAVLGILLSSVLGLILVRYYLRDYKVIGDSTLFKSSKAVVKYILPTFLFSLASSSFYSSDLILVKHFFDSHQAGIYASLSTLARIILFGTLPIGSVMFPIVSERHARGYAYKKIFGYSFLLTLFISSGVLFVYLLFPEIAIKMLFGSAYLEAAPHLFWFGVFMTLFTLSSLFISFFLSIGKTKIVIFPLIAAIAQIVGIWFWHETIFTVIKVSIISVSFLIISLLIYFGHESIKAKENS